jgi:hypothetical protein
MNSRCENTTGSGITIKHGKATVLFGLTLVVSRTDPGTTALPAEIPMSGHFSRLADGMAATSLLPTGVRVTLRPRMTCVAAIGREGACKATGVEGVPGWDEMVCAATDWGGPGAFVRGLPATGIRVLLVEVTAPASRAEELAAFRRGRGDAGMIPFAQKWLEPALEEALLTASERAAGEVIIATPIHWGRLSDRPGATLLDAYDYILNVHTVYAQGMAGHEVAAVATRHGTYHPGKEKADQVERVKVAFFARDQRVLAAGDFDAGHGVSMEALTERVTGVLDASDLSYAEFDRGVYPVRVDGEQFVTPPVAWRATGNWLH